MKKLIFLLFSVFLFANDSIVDDIIKDLDDLNVTKLDIKDVKNYLTNLKLHLDDNISKNEINYNISSYHQTYFTLFAYSPQKLIEKYWDNGIRDYSRDYERKKTEANFQISIKVPLFRNFLNSKATLFFGYTQNSFWQVYNKEHSAPFRETNYQPELFLNWNLDKKVLKKIRLSFVHQSNGQDVGKSRSWNKTQISFLFKKQNYSFGFDFWDRWDEDKKQTPTSPNGDDNPNLEDYIGKNRVFIRYTKNKHKITLTHQNDIFHYNINIGYSKLQYIFPC